KGNGGQEIVNTYRFQLTPLRSGEVVIPVMRFTGTHMPGNQWNAMPATASGETFTIASGTPLALKVRAAHAGVTPWLPLHDLTLRARMSQEQRVKEGTPVTLTLELAAKGALGDQLPTLEQQLKSGDFRVYRESTEVKNGISRDGLIPTGSRIETYTLIPLKDGWIRLPNLGVTWWDIGADKAMVAGMTDAGVTTAGAASVPLSQHVDAGQPFSRYFWVPLLITLGLIIGYWLGVWVRTKSLFSSAGTSAGVLLTRFRQQNLHYIQAVRQKITPSVYTNKLRMGLAYIMPTSIKLWMCTRCVEQEENPAEWCQQFKTRICQHLKIATHTPLVDVAERLIEVNPQAEPATVRALAHSLDGAIYGGQPLDFPAWKQDFRNQLRPRLYRRHRRRAVRAGAVLPELNPHTAA
ncbi:MAG: BatD family protein, partial [Gammaproteobacteria bacterium]